MVVNQANGVENTALLVQYCALDERVRPLIIAIKYWAKCRGVCNARNATLSSYGWVLLVIHFLQHTAPPVLPVLLREMKGRSEEVASGGEQPVVWSPPPAWAGSCNEDSMATLMFKFFAYYSMPHAADVSTFHPGYSNAVKTFNMFRRVVTLDGNYNLAKAAAPTESAAADATTTDGDGLEDPPSGLPEAPWWRLSILDPIDGSFDVGRVVCRYEGQIFILDELRRGVRMLLDESTHSARLTGTENPFEALCAPNEHIPDLSMQCHLCGEQGHMSADCTERCCITCKSKEHTTRDCPIAICVRCTGSHHVSQCPQVAADRGTSIIAASIVAAGNSASVMDRAGRDGDGFMEEVLAWRANEFLNQQFLRERLHKIPLVFDSSTAWYQYFYPFLLEEMRAQIEKAVETTATRSVVSVHCAELPVRVEMMSSIPAYLILPSGLDEAKFEEACTCTVGLLVKQAEKRDLTPAALTKQEHVLVRIEFPLKADDKRLKSHESELIKQNPGCMIFHANFVHSPLVTALLFGGSKSKWELFALGVGTYSAMRTCDALAAKGAPPLIMPDVVSGQPSSTIFTSALARESLRGTSPPDVADEFTASLNESQQEAINQLLEVGGPLNLSSIQLIKGPPGELHCCKRASLNKSIKHIFIVYLCLVIGTGKTATLVALLQTLSKCNLRVHAAAPTNVAVCELARRCLEEFSVAKSAGTAHGKRLSHLLLVGNRTRLKVVKGDAGYDPLQRILFDDRLRRLQIAAAAVREHSLLLQAALRNRASQLADDGNAVAANAAASDTSAEPDANLAAHVKVTTAAKTLLAGLQVLAEEAPDGALRGLTHKDVRQLLGYLAGVQDLSVADFYLWKGLGAQVPQSATSRASAEEARIRTHLHDMFKAVNDLLKKLTVAHDKLGKLEVLQAASLVFSTVNVGGRSIFYRVHFDVAVIDEATQLLQAETAIVLRHRLRCLVLAGDDKQLPATVLSSRCAKLGYDESLFSRLLKLKYPYVLLNTQYRMHPAISRWPRMQFYHGAVIDGPNVLSPMYTKDWHAKFPPLSIYDLTVGQEEEHEHGSMYNEAEALLVRRIVKEIRDLKVAITVGIISPYSAQIIALEHLNSSTSGASASGDCVAVRVNTIDSFQGQECDVIIFSTVRSNDKKNIGFVSDERRLNVAVTRAKYALVVICNIRTFGHTSVWNSLFEHARRERCLFDVANSPAMQFAAKKYENVEQRMVSLETKDVFGDATWKIFFCTDFKTAFTKLTPKLNQQVIKTCLGLANGEWPKFDLVATEVPDDVLGILHVHRVLHCRLIWSVDIARSTHEQCLKVWNVVLVADVAHAVRRVVTVLRTYSSQYLQRCAEIQNTARGSRATTATHLPKKWAPDEDFVWLRKKENIAAEPGGDLERSSVGSSAVLTKFFALTSDVARMLTSSNNFAAIELPFVMSDKEDAIVRYNGSIFVLGRSGTGKTTVILHRMFLLSKINEMLENAGSASNSTLKFGPCKQLLVTASSILCEAIRRSYDNMCKTAEHLSAHSKAEAPAVTSNVRDDAVERSLPRTFQHCLPQDFPLIVTYMSFLRMLDASLDTPFFGGAYGNEVDFMRFSTHYFPHFSSDVSKLGDAALVFTEIMSHIKGSVAALHTETGHLSREDYVALATSRGSTLSSSQRSTLYEVFLKYQKLKAQTYPGDFDVLDAVFHVYSTLTRNPAAFHGELMTGVSVDEVQDLVPAQIVLFKFVCANPAGFVFAGDTAQTIAHGVGFRFETVKDIFFHEYVSDFASTPEDRAALVPEVRHLSENFRTHTGVVMIANSVVELVLHFFPNSIDKLDPECSLVVGPPPIFIDGEEDLVMSLFQNSTMHSCEFGAEQVILVRDEETKRSVMEISGNRALVLTVLESKGMEFTDCLIYNFFGSSPLKNDWRVLYNLVDPSEAHPAFDAHKYSALCVELKFLYVLLTRARQHVIIFDSDIKSREPMLRYWLKQQLVEKKALDEDIRGLFLTTSAPEEWQERGKQFFERKQYANARLCYQRAGDQFQERLCNAAELEQEGDKVTVSAPAKACALYLKAAESYLQLTGYTFSAARCFELAGEFTKAAKYFTEVSKFKDAGRCFEKVDLWDDAAHCYEKLGDVENALRCCYKPRNYDLALVLLESFRHNETLPQGDFADRLQECAKKAAIYFHSNRCIAKMMEYVGRFRETEEKRSFLKRYKHFDLLLQIEIADKCFAPAARIYEDTYDYTNAQLFYEKASLFTDVARCALKSVRIESLNDQYIVSELSSANQQLLKQLQTATTSVPETSVHSLAVELLLLTATDSAHVDAGKKIAAGKEQLMTSLQRVALKVVSTMGTESTWMLRLDLLRHQLRVLVPATVSPAAIKSPASVIRNRKVTAPDSASPATSVTQALSIAACQTCCNICKEFEALVQFVSPTLAVVSTLQNVQLTSAQHKILLQCVDYFEFMVVSTTSTSFASTYITATSEVECLSSLKGLRKVFAVQPPAATTAPGAKPSAARCTIKMSIKEFSQHALRFFRRELSYWLQQCGTACEKALASIPILTFTQRAELLLIVPRNRPSMVPATSERYQLLSCWSDCIQMESALNADTNEPQAQTKARELKHRTVQASLISILLPAEPLVEDIRDVSQLRVQDLTRVSQLVQTIHNTEFRQPGLNYDLFARALLTAELSGSTTAVAARLRKIMYSEFQYNRNLPARHKDVLQSLVEGFAWESVSDPARKPRPHCRTGPFFYGIQCIASCVYQDIERRDGGMNAIMFDGEIRSQTSFSPCSFVKLTQKCVLHLLLHWKSFANVVVPTTLAMDILARRHSSYKRAIGEYTCLETVCKDVLRDRSIDARGQLRELARALLYLLDKMTPTAFAKWHACHSKPGDTAAACKDAQDSFCSSVLQLLVVFIINSNTDDYNRAKYCDRIAKQRTMGTSTVHQLPYHLDFMLSKVNSKELNSIYGEFCRTTGDALLILHCTHSCGEIPRKFQSMRPTRMILEVGAASVCIVPHVAPVESTAELCGENAQEEEPAGERAADVTADAALEHTTVAAPHEKSKEEKMEPFHTILRRLAKEARVRIATLSPVDALKRFVEREFLHAITSAAAEAEGTTKLGTMSRWSPVVTRYTDILCPLYMELKKLADDTSNAIAAMESKVRVCARRLTQRLSYLIY